MPIHTYTALNPLARLLLAVLMDNREAIAQEHSFLNPERLQKTPKHNVQIISWDPAHQHIRNLHPTSTSPFQSSPHLQQLTFSKTGLNKESNLSLWQLPSSACQGWNTRKISSNPAIDWPTYWLVAATRYTCQGVYTHAECICRAPDEMVHWHLHFQGKSFALNRATHIAVNLHDKKAMNFLFLLMFFCLL